MSSKYSFNIKKSYVSNFHFPKTTSFSESSIEENISVNCINNFSEDERKIIDKFNINTLDDLINHTNISIFDKQKCKKNTNTIILMNQYSININICSDNSVKYCKSLGLNIHFH